MSNRVGDVTIVDVEGIPMTPNKETSQIDVKDSIALLERLVKVCETLQVVDSAQRQRVTLDAISAALTLATVTTVTTVSTVSTVASVTNVAAQAAMAGMDREMYINIAKQTYALSIRANLTFQ